MQKSTAPCIASLAEPTLPGGRVCSARLVHPAYQLHSQLYPTFKSCFGIFDNQIHADSSGQLEISERDNKRKVLVHSYYGAERR